METHLDNLCQLDFGIFGLYCGVHTVKQSDLLVSQWTLDAPQCSSYSLSGHFLLLLSYTASVSSSGGLLLSHVAHPLAKHHILHKKASFTQKHKKKIILTFYRQDLLFRGVPTPVPTDILSAERINHVALARKGILKKIAKLCCDKAK